jgi:ribonuclease E
MLMNVVDPEEVRVAIESSDGLEELYIERTGGGFVYGNIYKGKVQNIEPTLQAAFVDIGSEKNGFLHASDVVPPFGGYDDILKRRRRKAPKDLHRMPIEKMLYKGQEVLVQITREQLGNKGPSLTTYISLPGRYLVLMPAVKKRGVSRKISNDKERKELKSALDELDPPEDLGFIIRTAGMGRGQEELKRDLEYLLRLWNAIVERTKSVRPVATIYQESDLVIRSIRDYFSEDIEQLVVDREEECQRAKEFLHAVMPGYEERARFYDESVPLFERYGVESEIETIFSRSVPLKSGGEIVIEQTEAMVAIDVNTGRYKGQNTRETILAINREAAREIARQLRLRDLGGLIMIDYIDMDQAQDRRAVEDVFREACRPDRARKTMLPISQLGVMEMTRQRMRQSLKRTYFNACPACRGSGMRKSGEVLAVEFVRRLRGLFEERDGHLTAYAHPDTALQIANAKRAAIAALESERNCRVRLAEDPRLALDEFRFEWDEGGGGSDFS